MKTFIKWSGNKSKHINKIKDFIPKEYNVYIEPFLGSGAMFLYLQPSNWIINDINKDLINIWKNVMHKYKEIIKIFQDFKKNIVGLNNTEKIAICKQLTSKIPELKYDVKRASIFLLMKYCAYMGHIFVNNVFVFHGLDGPLYNGKQEYFLSEKYSDNLTDIHKYMIETNGKILNTDYKNVLKKAKRDDFVFLDPPYIEEHNYKFNYNKNEKLNMKFVKELYKQVKELDKRGVKWLMTQADTHDVRTIFQEYNIKEYSVYRAISKTYKKELIIMNY